ncbi:MAG: helix-turn-helix transcriptional regulator [Acetatifactor sp.]|nr:helix-turn-helix transcriptional regulator [Acetatifactor sp.]MDE6700069.1 helix-turn-helix transcriptional regulator [Acetatifactor sp.]MDE7270933.1 helix-turn-helix transcriptional regulator [Acetatifactor sp.]
MTAFEVDVKKRLIDKGMTHTELAERLGIKKQYLTLVLSGERKNSRYVEKIREILEIEEG